ncbi:YheC/YheD family endospore coat-associated protein [Paenibacillus sp. y28]|uniref:YheC/YheD family endospore coat-associated protein n=1 Tax=Paenibacillus sp. y28 TaxID=3129110 RepID=UPI003019F55A
MLQQYVGVLVSPRSGSPPFGSRRFLMRLCRIGAAMGMGIYVFRPSDIDWSAHHAEGYEYDSKSAQWIRRTYPLPSVVYDRGFFTTADALRTHRACIARLESRSVRIMGGRLAGKWDIQQLLGRNRHFAPYLPPTERLDSAARVLARLKREQVLFLKPAGGSQGRGALRIARTPDGRFEAGGRDRIGRTVQMQFGSQTELAHWLPRFTGRRAYLIQPYLDLAAADGRVYDIRVLVQKNRHGRWQESGIAARIGSAGSVTSNLHGGGTAEDAEAQLTEQFGAQEAEKLTRRLKKLAALLPPYLEQHFPSIAELGLDFGIDRTGRIWILECNSKPGRSAFARLSNRQSHWLSHVQPLRYARYILDRHLGG